MNVSHETIYRSLYVQARGALKSELKAYLRTGRARRRPRRERKVGTASIVDGISISERPPEVADRAVPGHWEGDLIFGNVHSYIATLVERTTRFCILVKVPSKDTHQVTEAIRKQISKLPEHLRKSLTWDRGSEMSAHKAFSVASNIPVFFADPRSPWQRGTNENTNKLLRQWFPKGADLSQYSQAELNKWAALLNGRPRQTLGWRTPAQALNALLP
jgi:IS30 family transposase